ncbi:MAG TPA: mechanosensitive ion channel [Hadesarchaea archaeon]|nr:mechanosensitive ion channel [Hadesarchaea archaeon]
MEVWNNIVYILVTFAAFVVTILTLRGIIRGKLRRLGGYQKLANIFYGITSLIFTLVILYILGILSLIVSIAAALGIIGVIFGFAFITAWLANAIAGVSLVFDKIIEVGARIEIDGVEGVVTQISLTSTKVLTNDKKLLIIPNSSFRTHPYLIVKESRKTKN